MFFVSLALSAAMLTGGLNCVGNIPTAGPVYASASAEKLSASARDTDTVTITDYTSTKDSITLEWKSDGDFGSYYICVLNEDSGKYEKVGKTKDTSYTVKNLEAGTQYRFVIRPAKNGKYGRTSESYSAVTEPVGVMKIRNINMTKSGDRIRLSWKKAYCTGYAVYVYSDAAGDWVKIGQFDDPSKTSYTFSFDKAAKGGVSINDAMAGRTGKEEKLNYKQKIRELKEEFGDFYEDMVEFYGGERALVESYFLDSYYYYHDPNYGYRFKVSAYSKDEDGNKIIYGTPYETAEEDAYISITSLTEQNKKGVKTLAKASKTKKGTQKSFTYYQSASVSSTTSYTVTMTNGDLESIKAFEKKYFKDSWTDEQKLLFTANWINKFVKYDYEWDISSKVGGFAERIFKYRCGQCDAYNGALVEMALYLGYKDLYLHWWDSSVGGNRHARAFIKINNKYYSFEDGNAAKSGAGWFWFCERDTEMHKYIKK